MDNLRRSSIDAIDEIASIGPIEAILNSDENIRGKITLNVLEKDLQEKVEFYNKNDNFRGILPQIDAPRSPNIIP